MAMPPGGGDKLEARSTPVPDPAAWPRAATLTNLHEHMQVHLQIAEF
jgi:hypothetical protein